MKRGYIRLWRRIWDNWTWKKSFPKSKAEAWIDLILMAQGVPKKVMIEGQEQILKRGQILTSILTLSRRWGWNRNKVRFFLKRLSTQSRHKKDTEKDTLEPQIGQQKGHTYLIITICNYSLYNPLSEKKDTKKDSKQIKKGHRKETQKDTTKKDKEGINKEKPLLVRKIKKEYFELVDLLNEKMLENDSKAKIADTEDRKLNWANSFRLLIERDEREIEEAREILIWCQEDSFWQGNILSASKFRKQYGQLKLKKDRDRPKRKTDAEVLAEREAFGKKKEKEDRERRKTRV